jgi:hypothetical protein
VCVVEDGEWKLDRLSSETTQPLFGPPEKITQRVPPRRP